MTENEMTSATKMVLINYIKQLHYEAKIEYMRGYCEALEDCNDKFLTLMEKLK